MLDEFRSENREKITDFTLNLKIKKSGDLMSTASGLFDMYAFFLAQIAVANGGGLKIVRNYLEGNLKVFRQSFFEQYKSIKEQEMRMKVEQKK